MTTRDNQDVNKEDKHLKLNADDRTSKNNDKLVKKSETTKEEQKMDTSEHSKKAIKASDYSKGKSKLEDYGKTEKKNDRFVARPFKKNKINYTNLFKPIPHRDAETMTDLLHIFETPSNSIFAIFKTPSACLQEIEVMTDLTGDEISKEIGLKEMETSTDDLAKTVLQMTNDLDYMNLKLLEDERERKLVDHRLIHGVDGLEGDENKLPEEKDGIHENLLEKMYICLGIAPIEVNMLDSLEEAIGNKFERQESLKIECPSQNESSDQQKKIEAVNVIERKIPDNDVTNEEDIDEIEIIDEIDEGLMYTELNEAYQFRELFHSDEAEVYVEENINFEDEDLFNQDPQVTMEGFFHPTCDEIEVEESFTEIMVIKSTSDELVTDIDRGSGMDKTYDSNILDDVILDVEYQDVSEKLFLDEEIEKSSEGVADEDLVDTAHFDRVVEMVADDNLDFLIDVELNYPEYDDQWELASVIEFLSGDKSIGKILKDFGFLEELDQRAKDHSHSKLNLVGRTDSYEMDDPAEISYFDQVTKYAEQTPDWTGLDSATANISNHFRVSMFYSEEGTSNIDVKAIQYLLNPAKRGSLVDIESWLHRESRYPSVLNIDQVPYINLSESEYEMDIDSQDLSGSVDDSLLEAHSSDEIDRKTELLSETFSDCNVIIGNNVIAGSSCEIDINCEGYPRIIDQIIMSPKESSSNFSKTIQADQGEKKVSQDSVSLSLDDDNYIDDNDDDDNSNLEKNELSYTDDSIDVIYELIKSDPYGSFISQKMLHCLEYFKRLKFQNEIPQELKAIEALLIKKAARKKFTETLLIKSARHMDQNLNNYSCKPELFNDSVSVLVWNIFRCFFLPISSKLPSQRQGSSQGSYSKKHLHKSHHIIKEIPNAGDSTKPNDKALKTNLKMVIKSRKPLVSPRAKIPVTVDERSNTIAIQTEIIQNEIETPSEVDFVIIRRYKTMEVQTDVSFVAKIKEDEALLMDSFVIHNHTATQTMDFSPDFAEESFSSLDGTITEAEEDEYYWKNVENIFSDDTLVQEKIAKICSKKGRAPIEILITIGKDGKKLFAPLRSDKGLEGAIDPRLEQFLSLLNESAVSNLFEDLLHQPVKSEISRIEKEGQDSLENFQTRKDGSQGSQVSLEDNMIRDESRKYGNEVAGSELLLNPKVNDSYDYLEQMTTNSSKFGEESGKTSSDWEVKERRELESLIKTGMQFLEQSEIDQVSKDESSESSTSTVTSGCNSSNASFRRFYLSKFLDQMESSSSFSSVITISEVDEFDFEFISDSGTQSGVRVGERTILKGGLQDQKKSVTIFKEISLRDSIPVYDTDKDYEKKQEIKAPRKLISFRHKPREIKPIVVKNWLVKNEKGEWIMVKQYHLFKRIHHYSDMYGSFDQIQKYESKKFEAIRTGPKPIRGILFSYFFPKNAAKFGFSAKDRENLEYLSKSDVAWNRIIQKNPERDPYRTNLILPQAFTKNFLKIEKHSSLMVLGEKTDQPSILSLPRSESVDSNYEFIQLVKMEGAVDSSDEPEEIKSDLPTSVFEVKVEPMEDEVISKEENYGKFTTDELQNILVDLLIENLVYYDIDCFEKPQQKSEIVRNVEKITKIDMSPVEKIDFQIMENGESTMGNIKTEIIKADSTSNAHNTTDDLSFTESELHLISSQTLKAKRKFDDAFQYRDDIVLSERDLKELIGLLSGSRSIVNTGSHSIKATDGVHFCLDNIDCLHQIFTSVQLVEDARNFVQVSELNRNHVLKFVKFIVKEIYLHMLSLTGNSNSAIGEDNLDVLVDNNDGERESKLKVEKVSKTASAESLLLYLGKFVNTTSDHRFSFKNEVNENKYTIFLASRDLEIIREKFFEQALPLVKLLERKDLSDRYSLVFTKSEISLLNMIYLNEQGVSQEKDQTVDNELNYQDSLMDLMHTIQKHLSNKFSNSSIVDIKSALSRFEDDWKSSRYLNDQNEREKCAISTWAEKICSSKHNSHYDRECLKEVLMNTTTKIDHLDRLEEYLESKNSAEKLTDEDADSLEREIEIFDDDEKTRKAIGTLKNILINRILSAEDLLLPTRIEPTVSESSLIGDYHTAIDSESFVEVETQSIAEDYSDSKTGDLNDSQSLIKRTQKKDDRILSEHGESNVVLFTTRSSKFPYLKTRKFASLRRINSKTRILKSMSRVCELGASKRLKSSKVQRSKMLSLAEKCVGKVDFKLIHDRGAKFKRKLALIHDKAMMYNTYFSYGFGKKSISERKQKKALEVQSFPREEERYEIGLDSSQTSLSSLSDDLRHPLFSVDSLDDLEMRIKTDNKDECNNKLMLIREGIKQSKVFPPLKEKYLMPRIQEVDANDLSIAYMSSIHRRRVRHLKSIVSGQLTDSITSLPPAESFKDLTEVERKSRSGVTSEKSDLKLPYLSCSPEISEEIPIIPENKAASHITKSNTFNEKLKLPVIVDAKQKDNSAIMNKGSKESRPTSSAKSIPICVKLSKTMSDLSLESKQATRKNNDNYRLLANLKCDDRVRRDLMKLLDEPAKFPYLKPPPEYRPVPGFNNHPLLGFKLDENHVAQVHSFRMEKALKKAQFYKVSNNAKGKTTDEVEFMDPTKRITQPPLFPVLIVPRIIQKQVQSQCERFKTTVEDCVKEAKSIHDTVMFNKAVYDIIRVKEKPYFVHEFKQDVGGKTKNHAQFLEKRKRVRDLLLIGHTLLKQTYDTLLENIPNIFVDFGSYRNMKYYWDLQELSETMLTDLKKGCEHFCTVWYVKLDEDFRKPEVLKEMSCDNITRFMRLVCLILSYEISTAVDRTLSNFTDVFCDKSKIPRFMFKTTLEATEFEKADLHFCISPELKDIYKVVFNCLDCIFNIGQDLPMLFMPKCKPVKRYHKTKIKFIDAKRHTFVECPLNLPVLQNHHLYKKCHQALYDSLEDNFNSLRSYVHTLEHSFAFLTYSQYAISTSTFLNSGNITKVDVTDLLNIFKGYNEKIILMLPFATFSLGLMEQESAFKCLKVFVDDYIICCIQAVGRFLNQDHKSLKEEFERVKKRALKPAITSEELVALGDFMSYVQTRWMRDRSVQITSLSRYYWKILEYFRMPHSDYSRSLIDWFVWYLEMFPVFEQFATVYEQIKFEFDEKIRDTVALIEEKRLEFVAKMPLLNNLHNVNEISSYKKFVKRYLRDIEFITEKMEWINNEEKLYHRTITKFGLVEDICNILLPFCKLIFKIYSWFQKKNSWMNNSFDLLIPEEVENAFDRYYKDLLEMSKDLKILCRSLEKEDSKYGVFKGHVDAEDERQLPSPLVLCYTTLQDLREFQPILQLVSVICNKDLLERHWNEMSEIVGEELTPNAGMSLRKYIDFDLFSVIDKLEIVSSGATKELQLQEQLKQMFEEWKDLEFSVSRFKETDISILTGVDDIQALLDDHIVKTLAMRSSPFSKPVENEVKTWYDKLVRMNKAIDVWGKVQVEWLHLYPIFTSEDIKQQMPKEAKFFADVDSRFRNAIKLLMADRRAIVVAPAEGLLESLEACLHLMEEINNGVNLYLESKRLYFPRFFFLSNDEMLEILSQTTDPLRVQPHLKKCFEGIACLGFNEALDIYSMMSSEKEEITFIKKVSTKEARGSVEKWLVQVETQMLRSVKHVIKNSVNSCKIHERKQWVRAWPGQVVLCVSQAFWTAEVHRVLRKQQSRAVNLYHKKLNKQLSDIIQLVRGKLTMMSRITLGALVVLDVHSKDVTYGLYVKGIINERDFEWMAQLRYYWEQDMIVSITNASVNYAYEYLGNTARLVITPLTDRCYRTLVGAYHLHLNGAPEGPAGTGKTETTKDLAKALAVQCIVFNCSDGLDYIAMGKFFKGLAACGAWACFDEFNRIEVEVLSVVGQQILCIVQAVRKHVKEFVFEGTTLNLNPSCYVCITMNPGYAGRSELPDNLKVLFRTVAMMVPDYGLIGEISLYSCGFINARKLSEKIVTTYRLCSEQLSSQSHYDYGMRAVKTVLQAAGNLKLKFPKQSEEVLLLRSIMDVNLPKFLNYDVPLFEGIISDLFPGVKLPTPNYDKFIGAIKKCCEKRFLQPSPAFITKIIQTYEMMVVRHGFMLVGDPFSGKTCTLHVLADAISLLTDRKRVVKYQTLNPKSVTMGQLYGKFDDVSHEWTDGVLANAFREFAMSTSDERKWVIFDGPVDAVWIENMNTVLDDNKKLCLNSGEVMQMTGSMSMIFEVMDLTQASPATVSRCGMIYMESSTLGWTVLVDSWLIGLPESIAPHAESISSIIKWMIPPCLTFCRKHCISQLNAGVSNTVRSLCNYIAVFLNSAILEHDVNQFNSNALSWIQAAVIMSAIWTFSGTLDADSRVRFDAFFKNLVQGLDPEHEPPEAMSKLLSSVPAEGIWEDNYFMFKGRGFWSSWAELAHATKIAPLDNLSQLVVPTLETVKYQYIIEKLVQNFLPVCLMGPTGTGKSFYMDDLITTKLSLQKFEPSSMTFTVNTQPNLVQTVVLSKLIKRKKSILGPPIGKHCLIFIDDMNMPAKEVYGAQPPLELLRMYFDHGYWFDLKDMNKIFVEDLFFVAAMGPAGGSRQDVYARFLRHFCLLSINLFTESSMTKIYGTLLFEAMRRKGFGVDFVNMFRSTVTATINVYQKSILNLLPTPAKSHYTFNLRDISRVINGVMMFNKESFQDKPDFISVWLHEMLRVFSDRLIESQDRQWFFTQLKENVKFIFRTTMEETLTNMKRKGNEVSEEDMTNLIFTSIFDLDNPENKLYEQVVDMEPFIKIVQDNLDTYNHMHKTKIDIVLFRYALVHLSRILRLLSMPGGNGLLVGVAGSGRQSLTKLAASVYRMAVFQPEIKEPYDLNEWRDDLKVVMKECGGRCNPMVFLFTENQIKHEYFLQDIDVLLNTGEVPNIYSLEETQEVLEMARLGAQGGNRNLDVHPLSVLSYFRSQCKRNIHLMICFSPIGNSFRNRIRLYPAFVNCCTIDWYEDWPEDALEKVAERYFDNDKFNEVIKRSLVSACKYFHVTTRHQAEEFFLNTGRKTYITSGSYLNLIRLYTNLFDLKQKEVMEAKMRYVIGLDSLQFAADQISVMKQELEALQPQLRRAAEAAEETMRQIGSDRVQVEAATQLVQRDEVVAEAKAKNANLLKQECQVELAAIIPILNEAVAALNILKPNDITVVKAMKNPPKTVKLVMAAVCIMMGVKAAKVPDPNSPGRFKMDFWIPSVRLLSNINFLKNLKEYDKDNIQPAIISIIRKEYIPNKEFNPAVVKKASKAAEGLCKWVLAMEQYDEVIKIVAPKKERMEKAEEEYERTMQELNDKKALLRGFEEKLALLEERLSQTVALKAQLTQEANMCWEKLQRAQQLIGGLGGEKQRWTEAANSLQTAYDNLAGDMLLSSAFVAYLGPFTTAYRHPLISNWKQKTGELRIPCSSNFDFIRLVGKDYVIQQWHLDGLPKDKFSVENGVIMGNTNRYTFLIDPEGQANRWLKTMFMDSNMEVLKISDKHLMKKVETSILYGQPVLLEDVGEELDACLDPILLRITFKQGGRDYITIGTKVIELHKDFNLFITTRLRCPHLLPEVLNKVTVINFALTKEALEDQLLAIAITILSPDLEARRASMIVQRALNTTALRNAEEDILKALSAPDKNVLEDENTITILDESKKIAADIKEREKGTIETSHRISDFNDTFSQPVIYARSLYYCLTDLPNIDPMYHFSLPWFLRIYSGSLKADYDHFVEISSKSESERKKARFMPNMTFSLYSNVCRSLFEKDKLLFSFILCTNLMLTESKIRMEDLSFLLTGGVVLVNLIPNPAPDWILIRSWDELCRLTLLDGFQGLKEHVENNLPKWRKYYDAAEPHKEPLPKPWDTVLTPFQILLVLRIFHLDKMVPAIRNFIEHEMDEAFVTPPLFDIAESYKDSNKVTPMVFILSPGVDPMSALQQFAEKMGYKEHEFESVSLGQGQGPIAENLIKKARLGGTWVCLQNCHLATSWMPTLEALCDDLASSTKEGFRLWLTSYPSEKFPVPILQNGVKMTNEPPTGLKQNMLRTFSSEPITDQDFYNSCNADDEKQFVFARLLFGLTFFHAVVLERKKYGPIGWNIPYGFNESDFNISVLQLQEYMMDSEEVPFEAVTYLTGECNYGGRVTDNWDRRTLITILASFVNAHIAANQDYYMLDNFSELLVHAERHEFEYYTGTIENISDVQPAEVVGLNSNASISRDYHSTKALLEAMQLVQPKTRGGGSSKKEDEMVIAITKDIQQKLPAIFDLDVALERYPVSYTESMNTVLVQEMERFNRLTSIIRSSIRTLQRAIRGEAVMTPDLEATFSSVLANRLPNAWAKVSYPSLKPLAEYVADLIHRLRFLQEWFNKGIPPCFWLSGFFFTQAFLTAAMQNYARKHIIPIDLLTFDFVMTTYDSQDDVTSPPVDGIFIYGLFLEGARWDRRFGQLDEQMPKILFDIMPVIHFVPKQKKHTKEDGRYLCPLYKTSERRGILSTTGHSTNYVLPLLLACSRSPAHWVKRGTALLCQLDN